MSCTFPSCIEPMHIQNFQLENRDIIVPVSRPPRLESGTNPLDHFRDVRRSLGSSPSLILTLITKKTWNGVNAYPTIGESEPLYQEFSYFSTLRSERKLTALFTTAETTRTTFLSSLETHATA